MSRQPNPCCGSTTSRTPRRAVGRNGEQAHAPHSRGESRFVATAVVEAACDRPSGLARRTTFGQASEGLGARAAVRGRRAIRGRRSSDGSDGRPRATPRGRSAGLRVHASLVALVAASSQKSSKGSGSGGRSSGRRSHEQPHSQVCEHRVRGSSSHVCVRGRREKPRAVSISPTSDGQNSNKSTVDMTATRDSSSCHTKAVLERIWRAMSETSFQEPARAGQSFSDPNRSETFCAGLVRGPTVTRLEKPRARAATTRQTGLTSWRRSEPGSGRGDR